MKYRLVWEEAPMKYFSYDLKREVTMVGLGRR